MESFIIHTVPGSPFARSVAAALEEKSTRWRVAALPPGGLKTKSYTGRNPFGRMPLLEHDGFDLYETQAILRYIDRAIASPPLTPADPRLAARMDQVMNINDWYLFQGCANVIGFQRIVAPSLFGLTADEGAIRDALPHSHLVFGELARLLGPAQYFAGDTVSLADMLVAPQLDFLAGTPEWLELTAERPNLAAYAARMAARPSMRATTWDAMTARSAPALAAV